MFDDDVGAATDLADESLAKPASFAFVVLRRIVEFALSQLIERDAHRLDPSLGVPKYVIRRTT